MPEKIEKFLKKFKIFFKCPVFCAPSCTLIIPKKYLGNKFDVVFIDASHTEPGDELNCPIYEFRTEDMASDILKILSEKGEFLTSGY